MTDQHERLYILSFDHRGSFKKGLMGISADPTAQQRERISELKMIIYDGFERAIADGAPRDACGVLVDEEFGTEIARAARADGLTLAMPVERSGRSGPPPCRALAENHRPGRRLHWPRDRPHDLAGGAQRAPRRPA